MRCSASGTSRCNHHLKGVGCGRRYCRTAKRIAGERAQSAVGNRHQLIGVGVEQHAALLELDACIIEQQLWRPNVGIAELGEHNLYHLGPDGLEPITMVMVEFRRGRSAEKRLALGRAIVDTCVDLLGVPRRTVMVEFTPHAGEEILRDGNWTGDWTPAEAVTG